MHRLDSSLTGDLWVFKIVAGSESLTSAASQLCVTPAAVTQRIQKLESRLNMRLLTRTSRKLVLTEQGRQVFDAICLQFDDIEDGVRRVAASGENARLRVVCSPTLSTCWLVPRLPTFMALFPELDIEILCPCDVAAGSPKEDIETTDLWINYGPLGAAPARVLLSQREQLLPVVSPHAKEMIVHEWQGPSGVHLLHDAEPWLPKPSCTTTEWDYWLRQHGQAATGATTHQYFNMAHAAYRAAARGEGVAMGKVLSVQAFLNDGSLVALDDKLPIASPWGYEVSAGASGTRVVRDQFVDWLATQWEQGATLQACGQ